MTPQRFLFTFCITALLSAIFTGHAFAQDDSTAAPAAETAPATNGEDVEKFYDNPVENARFYYRIGRHEKALTIVEEALADPEWTADREGYPDLLFIKANILALRKDWAEAAAIYEQLREKWPDASTVGGLQTRFNLAEVYYVMGDYQKALPLYNELYGNEEQKTNKTFEYLKFKLFLTNHLLGNAEESNQVYETFDEMDLNPSYYYASAARSLSAGNVEEGLEYIRSAWSIYNERSNKAYTDALRESGLLTEDIIQP